MRVVVYSKDGCHLCEDVISILQKLGMEKQFELSSSDITAETELFERYKNIIPVVEIDEKIRLGGSTLSNRKTLESTLRKALTI